MRIRRISEELRDILTVVAIYAALFLVFAFPACGWLTTSDGQGGATPLDQIADGVATAGDTGAALGIPYAKPVSLVLGALLTALGARKLVQSRVAPKGAAPPASPNLD